MSILIVVLIALDISVIIALDVLEEKQRKEREDEEIFNSWYEANKEKLMWTASALKASKIVASNIKKTSEIDPNVARAVLTGRRKEVDKVDEGTEE